MQASISGDGEIDKKTVNQAGTVYLGEAYIGKEVEIAFEVIEGDSDE